MHLAELGSISERRTYLLLEGHDGLPKLLMKDTGVNSGFMIPQYTAAALVSENKILCHPASVDSIPTSLGQEDHVSMGSISALKLLSVSAGTLKGYWRLNSLTAAQALDFRTPLKPGKGVLFAHEMLRRQIGHAQKDYEVRNDLDLCASILRNGELATGRGSRNRRAAPDAGSAKYFAARDLPPGQLRRSDAGLIDNAAVAWRRQDHQLGGPIWTCRRNLAKNRSSTAEHGWSFPV